MLRIGISAGRIPRSSFGTHRAQGRFWASRVFGSSSSNDDRDKEQQTNVSSFNDPSSSSNENENGGTDALRLFFEKRRAALQKEQDNERQRQMTNDRNSKDTSRSRGNQKNTDSNFSNQRKNKNMNRNPSNNGKSKNAGSNNKTQKPQNQRSRPPDQRQKNRRQNRNPPRDSQVSSGPKSGQSNDTSRLADLMRQLRRDAPNKKDHKQHNNESKMQQFSARNRQRKPWKDQEERGSYGGGNKQKSGWNRPFLKSQHASNSFHQQNSRRPGRKFQQHRKDADFLQGRLGRSQGDDKDDGLKPTMASQLSSENDRRSVILPNHSLSVSEASALFRVKVDDIQKALRHLGFGSDSDSIDADTMELLAMEWEIETERSTQGADVVVDNEELLMKQRRIDEHLEFPSRPPVVCIMGHVDHGKTTLMDALRRRSLEQQPKKSKKSKKSKKGGKKQSGASKNVAGTEAGGITQIISAFQVSLDDVQDGVVTFLDTPGHAAFKAMRQSGSHAADVIVLVVAADDGVSEQTVEIIDFYKSIVQGSHEGSISMVVALNKIDKPGVDLDEAKMRIENQLLQHGIITESMNFSESEYGPPVQIIPTSGLTGLGLDELIEGLVLQSEVMDLRADDKSEAEGIVLDARMEKGLGVSADCIVRWGSIQRGDVVVSGKEIAKVKILQDVNGKPLKKGLPSQPVRIIGFRSLPKAGDPIICVESEEVAEELVERREALGENIDDRPTAQNSDIEIHIHGMRSRDTLRARKVHEKAGIESSDGSIRIPIIVKADADGSLSAVRDSLIGLGQNSSTHQVVIDPILEGIGDVTATDIQMAKESNAAIFAFGLQRMDQIMLNLAESEDVMIRSNDIIYSLLDDARNVLGKYLPAIPVEHVHGRGAVQAIFDVDTEDGAETVAGLRVIDGNIYKEKAEINSEMIPCYYRVYRDGKLISSEDGKAATSLRRFKELVDSVRHGDECGVALSDFSDFEQGDEVECFSIYMKQDSL